MFRQFVFIFYLFYLIEVARIATKTKASAHIRLDKTFLFFKDKFKEIHGVFLRTSKNLK